MQHSSRKLINPAPKAEAIMNQTQRFPSQADILIVDDAPANLRLLSSILIQQGYRVRKAINGKVALIAVQNAAPDLIILDTRMPEMDGYEVFKQLKNQPSTMDIPVISLIFIDELSEKNKLFETGFADYITKPFQIEEAIQKVSQQIELKFARQEVEQLKNKLETQIKEQNQQLEAAKNQLKISRQDLLTGLPNRVLFLECLEEALHRAKSDSDYQFAVLFLDCDRFKVINYSLGYLIGDELLKALARRLKTIFKQPCTIARLGDDEFALLLSHIQDIDDATQVADKILASLTQPFHLQGRDVFISASIGIAWGCRDYSQPEHLLRDADTAMCRAKELGKSRYQVFDGTMHEQAIQFFQIEIDLRQSIKQEEFTVHYQPIIDLNTGKIAGLEALLRWQHPRQGLISPTQFMAVAEETGLIAPIGNWVLREACNQLRLWQKAGIVDESLTLSVNFSAQQFKQPDLIEQIDQILAQTQLNPECLKLEITESAIIENPALAIRILQQLKERKIQVSIDDFGIGYSSLSYLHSLPVDTLKVDKSFVQRLDGNPKNLGIVPAIIRIAQAMGMNAIAEGIETPQQLEQLRNLSCDFSQGYLFSRPLEAEQVIDLIVSNPEW